MDISFYLDGLLAVLSLEQRSEKERGDHAVALFGVQLVLNVTWSYLFFGLRNPLLAFFEIIVLWGAILITKIKFLKIDKTAGYLLVPYFLWVSFALVLNLAIVLLN